jgi:hypothetical protein
MKVVILPKVNTTHLNFQSIYFVLTKGKAILYFFGKRIYKNWYNNYKKTLRISGLDVGKKPTFPFFSGYKRMTQQ